MCQTLTARGSPPATRHSRGSAFKAMCTQRPSLQSHAQTAQLEDTNPCALSLYSRQKCTRPQPPAPVHKSVPKHAYLADIIAIQEDCSLGWVVEAEEQPADAGLAGTRVAHQRCCGAWCYGEAQVLQAPVTTKTKRYQTAFSNKAGVPSECGSRSSVCSSRVGNRTAES